MTSYSEIGARLTAVALAVAAIGATGNVSEGRTPTAAQMRRFAELGRANQVLRGEDGWLFLSSEALLLANTRIWGDPKGRTTLLRDEVADPLGPIVDFARQLRERNIDLLFVPVPSKLSIHADRLDQSFASSSPLELATRDLLNELDRRGVRTLDLAPRLLAERDRNPEPLYAVSDSHWSPRGCLLAAEAVVAALGVFHVASGSSCTVRSQERAPIDGDLRKLLPQPWPPLEERTFYRAASDFVAAEQDSRPASPDVMVIGDSHLLVYRTRKAGFIDHLECRLGRPVVQIAVQAGGPTAARQMLARDPGKLSGVRVVVWISAARLFVSGLGWQPVMLPEPANPNENDGKPGQLPVVGESKLRKSL